MYSANEFCLLFLFLVGIMLAAGRADAQPMTETFRTIEARVGQADHVVVGTIDKVSSKKMFEPGAIDNLGNSLPQFAYTVSLKIGEVLKGDLRGIVHDLATIECEVADKRYEEWLQAETTMLWFLGPTQKFGALRSWEILPLGQQVPAEDLSPNSTRDRRPQYSRDFILLKNNDAVLDCARAYARTSQKVQPIHPIIIPTVIMTPIRSGDSVIFVVPVEPTLEDRARQLITSPQNLAPPGKTLLRGERNLMHLSGVGALRYFRSDSNEVLLKKVLTSGDSHVHVPKAVYEVLLHWDVDVPLTESAQKIGWLNLRESNVSDRGLEQLAQLKNLNTLYLQNTQITGAGLKHLTRLEHLSSLNLQKTSVTDVGLRELARFRNLDWLYLQDTQVTDSGVAKLRTALPKCRIEVNASHEK